MCSNIVDKNEVTLRQDGANDFVTVLNEKDRLGGKI